MYLLLARKASKIPALYKSKTLKTGKKIINYCKAGFELIFLSSGWSNSERGGRNCNLETYCHSDWCLDRRIKQAEFKYISRNWDKCPDHSDANECPATGSDWDVYTNIWPITCPGQPSPKDTGGGQAQKRLVTALYYEPSLCHGDEMESGVICYTSDRAMFWSVSLPNRSPGHVFTVL